VLLGGHSVAKAGSRSSAATARWARQRRALTTAATADTTANSPTNPGSSGELGRRGTCPISHRRAPGTGMVSGASQAIRTAVAARPISP